MKTAKRILTILLIMSLNVFLFNCGKDDETDQEKMQRQKLAKTWTLVSAELDGVEAGQILSSFTLTIGNGYTYEVSGTEFPSPWAESSTWSFVSTTDNSGTIKRDDDVLIHYSFASNGQLTLTFTFTGEGYPGARASATGGDWIFVLE